MEKVTGYQTTAGKFFVNESEATKQEAADALIDVFEPLEALEDLNPKELLELTITVLDAVERKDLLYKLSEFRKHSDYIAAEDRDDSGASA